MKKLWLLVIGLLSIGLVFGWSEVSKRFGARSETVQVRRGPVVEVVYGLGSVVPRRTYTLKVGVMTPVRKLFVVEGDLVKRGQSLLELEESGLHRAPFAGTVTKVNFQVGEMVFPQAPIIEVVDLKDRYISVSLEQQGALRVVRGQKARVSFESMESQKIGGEVRAIFPYQNQFLLHIEAENLPERVLPGMTADVALEVGRKEDALLVPVAGISGGQVTLLRNGSRVKVPVRLGVVDGAWAELTDGDVREGDEVLTRK